MRVSFLFRLYVELLRVMPNELCKSFFKKMSYL